MTDNGALARRALEPLANAAKGNAQALLALADTARLFAENTRAVDLTRQALALEPDNRAIEAAAADLMARLVPGWHARIVHDAPRNQAFQDALNRAVTPEKRVLDIGTGSGLLAMMAARAGAQVVHCCELNPLVAEVAQSNVRANGYADRVAIHAKASNELDPEADLGGRADIIVSEIIGNDLVCENVLPSMRHAARRLAAPGAQFIPAAGEIRVALAWLDNLQSRYLGNVSGFDLSAFNAIRPRRFDVAVDSPQLALRGDPAILYRFDFAAISAPDQAAEQVLVSSGGPVNGIVQWFRLQMDASAQYENKPGPDAISSWGCVFFPLGQPIDLAPGDRIAVSATIANDRLRIWQS